MKALSAPQQVAVIPLAEVRASISLGKPPTLTELAQVLQEVQEVTALEEETLAGLSSELAAYVPYVPHLKLRGFRVLRRWRREYLLLRDPDKWWHVPALRADGTLWRLNTHWPWGRLTRWLPDDELPNEEVVRLLCEFRSGLQHAAKQRRTELRDLAQELREVLDALDG